MPTITRNQNRRILLTPTSVPVMAAKTISSLTRSGTTATAACTGHGLAVGNWTIISGSNIPTYNGPVQVVTAPDVNTFTYTMEADPGASSAGVPVSQQAVVGTIWGDGSTVVGNVTVGALPTAFGGRVFARVATTTAPTTACRVSVFSSESGLPGTWGQAAVPVDGTVTASDMSEHLIDVRWGKFILVVFWRVAGTAVMVDAIGQEDTSYTSTT